MLGRKKVAPVTTAYRGYLRGRLRSVGLLDDAEAKLYTNPELPTNLLVGYVLGALAGEGDALISEAQLDEQVAQRLAPTPEEQARRVMKDFGKGCPRVRAIGDPDAPPVEILGDETNRIYPPQPIELPERLP